MKITKPEVFLIARPQLDWDAIAVYLEKVGGGAWLDSHDGTNPDAQDLAEFAGKMCYRSWEPGLNPNVKKVRGDQGTYLENILAQQHGSVLEHAQFTFVFHNVTRVLTHELARHRPGTAVSQESLRFVRLDEIPFWVPNWAQGDRELMMAVRHYLDEAEKMQIYLADYLNVDELSMHEKKEKTSFMRRFAPEGLSTGLVWSANIRALRHVIESRTAPGAEEEIRLVFGRVGEIMLRECPALFSDYMVDGGHWVPSWRKV